MKNITINQKEVTTKEGKTVKINEFFAVGRLTRDTEIRRTKGSEPKDVANNSLAIKSGYENGQDKIDFLTLVAWEKAAERLSKVGRKGTLVSMKGTVAKKTYEKDGKINTTWEYNVQDFDVLMFPKTAEVNPAVVTQTSEASTPVVDNAFDVDFEIEIGDDDLPF